MSHADLPALVAAGLSDVEIADKLGVSSRTVLRWRQRAGLRSMWSPVLAPHGTQSRYRHCRCPECRAANVRAVSDLRRRYDALLPAGRNGLPWHRSEDIELTTGPGTLYQRARRLGRSYTAAQQRLIILRRRERANASRRGRKGPQST